MIKCQVCEQKPGRIVATWSGSSKARRKGTYHVCPACLNPDRNRWSVKTVWRR